MKAFKNLGAPEYLMLVSVAILLLITAKRLYSLSTDNQMSENAAETVKGKGNGNQFLSFSP